MFHKWRCKECGREADLPGRSREYPDLCSPCGGTFRAKVRAERGLCSACDNPFKPGAHAAIPSPMRGAWDPELCEAHALRRWTTGWLDHVSASLDSSNSNQPEVAR